MKTKHDLLAALYEGGHVGAANGVRCADLAARLDCEPRHVRTLVKQARLDGIALCGTPRRGYFVAETADELEETCRFLNGRSMCTLQQESAMRRMPLPDLLGQMRLPT